jgi:hypothetical protein
MRTRPLFLALSLALACGLWLAAAEATAFCGFYVAKADTTLWNRASQVALVRDGDRTVITMSNDFEGDPQEFAMVIPVPTKLEREQIHVGERALLERLDAFTAPRLVEYQDPDPCLQAWRERSEALDAAAAPAPSAEQQKSARAQGVTTEARYQVGEYDILILSAKQSRGLAAWLRQNDYRLPAGAERILGSYLKQGMRFFVAKVNLASRQRLGFSYLRPLQIAYESPKFMLPIRLGTVNARGPQELFVYALTRTGRVETTNYRTVPLPTDVEVPELVQAKFGDFYRDLFRRQVTRHDMRVVFLEHAWDMGWCDPCAAEPLSADELRRLGVFWVASDGPADAGAQSTFVTRLHLRYDGAHFPADLLFQETGNRENFQGRYVIRHPFTGTATCSAAESYRRGLRERQEREAATLADLTGWKLAAVREQIGLAGTAPGAWWRRLW